MEQPRQAPCQHNSPYDLRIPRESIAARSHSVCSGSVAAGGMGAWRPHTAARKPERERWRGAGAHSVGPRYTAGPHDMESIPNRHRWLWAEDDRDDFLLPNPLCSDRSSARGHI